MVSEFTHLVLASAPEPATVGMVQAPVPRTFGIAGLPASTGLEPEGPASTWLEAMVPRLFPPPRPPHITRQKTALLVDSDPQVAQALTAILSLQRIRLMTATSVAKAMDALETLDNGIAVVIANLGPTGQALSLLTAQRRARRPTPMVVMKAREDHRGWAAAVSAGAAAFVDCPIGPTELQLAIMRVCV